MTLQFLKTTVALDAESLAEYDEDELDQCAEEFMFSGEFFIMPNSLFDYPQSHRRQVKQSICSCISARLKTAKQAKVKRIL